jgi:hypothetical protein
LSHRYCHLPLSWKSWNRFECAVGGVRNSSTIAADRSNGVTNTRCCRYSCMRSWWWVEVPPETCRAVPDINKLCNFAPCWLYIGTLLGAHPILHISRIRVKFGWRATFLLSSPYFRYAGSHIAMSHKKANISL